MRDKLKDKNYFEIYNYSRKNSIIYFKAALKENSVKYERIDIVKCEIFKDTIQMLIAKYSAGYPIEDLYADYYEALSYMHQSWMVLDNRAFLKNGTRFNHYFGSDYDLMLWMLSLGFLLNVKEAEFQKLVEILDRFTVRDLLYETIIKAKIPSRPPILEESYKLIMDMPFVYEKLRRAVNENPDEYGKESAAELIRVFLKEDFYKRHKGFSFYDHHKSKNNIYYGYWSFESAAIAVILKLDVNGFENNKYFPKDMYEYALNQKE
jgi:hypothetical protein